MSKKKDPLHWFNKKVLGIGSSKKSVVTSSDITTESVANNESGQDGRDKVDLEYSLEYKWPNHSASSNHVFSYFDPEENLDKWGFLHLVDGDLTELERLEAVEVEKSLAYKDQVYTAVKWTLVGAYVASKTLWGQSYVDSNRVLSKFRNLERNKNLVNFIKNGIAFSAEFQNYFSGGRFFYSIASDHDQMMKAVESIARLIAEKLGDNPDADLLPSKKEEYIKTTAISFYQDNQRDLEHMQDWLNKDLAKCFSLPESEGFKAGLMLAKMFLLPIFSSSYRNARDIFSNIEPELDKLVIPSIEENSSSNIDEGKPVAVEDVEINTISTIIEQSGLLSANNTINAVQVSSTTTQSSSSVPSAQLSDFIVNFKPDNDPDASGIKITTSKVDEQTSNIDWIAEIQYEEVREYLLSLGIYQNLEKLLVYMAERVRYVSSKINFQVERYEVSDDGFKEDVTKASGQYYPIDLASKYSPIDSYVEINSGINYFDGMEGALRIGF